MIDITFANKSHRKVKASKHHLVQLTSKAAQPHHLFNTKGVVSFDILRDLEYVTLDFPNALFSNCGRETNLYDFDIDGPKLMNANEEISCMFLRHPKHSSLNIVRPFPAISRVALHLPKAVLKMRYSYLPRNKNWNLVVSVSGE